MNWTERLAETRKTSSDALLRAFWWTTFVPTARLLRLLGKRFIKDAHKKRQTTNWDVPNRRVMRPEDFRTSY
jgi:hypothetical protein